MGTKQELLQEAVSFIDQVKDFTLGPRVDEWLNKTYPPSSLLYQNLARLITAGAEEGWACNVELEGRRYRRSRVFEPSAETFGYSIDSVYMDNIRGQYHCHPHGEINMIVSLDEGAQFCDRAAGWTAPEPGSQHYPEVKGGRAIMLFFLPAGRISYSVTPPDES